MRRTRYVSSNSTSPHPLVRHCITVTDVDAPTSPRPPRPSPPLLPPGLPPPDPPPPISTTTHSLSFPPTSHTVNMHRGIQIEQSSLQRVETRKKHSSSMIEF